MLVGDYTININRETKLYYVHVPKTGGTTINVLFRNVFGALRSVTHAEAMLLNPEERELNANVCRERNFVSAHLPVDFFNVHFQPFGYKAIVTLRDPIEHFVSVIRWFARSTHTISDVNFDALRQSLRMNPNAFFEKATMEELEFFSAQQSKAIFGSSRLLLPVDAASRASWLIDKYDTILLTEDITRLGEHIKIDGHSLSFPVSHENVQSYRTAVEIVITDKILDLLSEDIVVYNEIKKISSFSVS